MGKRHDGLEELGYQIVIQCCEDYELAYKSGDADELLKCKAFLLSGKVDIYTMFTFDGKQVLKDLDKRLHKQYGDFEELFNKRVSAFQTKIDYKRNQVEITKQEIKAVLANKEMNKEQRSKELARLRAKRYRLIHDINHLKNKMKY